MKIILLIIKIKIKKYTKNTILSKEIIKFSRETLDILLIEKKQDIFLLFLNIHPGLIMKIYSIFLFAIIWLCNIAATAHIPAQASKHVLKLNESLVHATQQQVQNSSLLQCLSRLYQITVKKNNLSAYEQEFIYHYKQFLIQLSQGDVKAAYKTFAHPLKQSIKKIFDETATTTANKSVRGKTQKEYFKKNSFPDSQRANVITQKIADTISYHINRLKDLHPQLVFGNFTQEELADFQALKENKQAARFNCIIQLTNNSQQLLSTATDIMRTQLEKQTNNYSLHSDIERKILYFSIDSDEAGKALLQNLFAQPDIKKWCNIDTGTFPAQIYISSSPGTPEQAYKEINVQMQPAKQRINKAHLNISVSSYTTDGGIAEQFRAAFMPFTQHGQSILQYIANTTSKVFDQVTFICDSARAGNLAHAHHILSTLQLPSMPKELQQFKQDTIECLNRLTNELYHNKKSNNHILGQLKTKNEINPANIKQIYEDYLEALDKVITYDGMNYSLVDDNAKRHIIEQRSNLPGAQTAPDKPSLYSKLRQNPKEVTESFADAIENNDCNCTINHVIQLCKQKRFQEAWELGNNNQLFQQFPELQDDISRFLEWQKQAATPHLVEKPVSCLDKIASIQAEFTRQADQSQQVITQFNNYLQTQNNSMTDDHYANRMHKRVQALEKIKSYGIEQSKKSYSVSTQALQMLEKLNIDAQEYEVCQGNQIQHVLHQECIETIETVAQLQPANPLYVHKEALLKFNHAALLYCKSGDIEKSLAIRDLTYCLLDCLKAVGEGVFEGLILTGETIARDPLQFALYAFAGEYVVAYQLCKMAFNLGVISGMALFDPEMAHDQWQEYIKPINELLHHVQHEEIKLRDCIKLGSKVATNHVAETFILGGLENFCETIKGKALSFAKSSPQSAKQVSQSVQELAKKTRVVEKVSNMHEFFEKKPFGKFLKDKVRKTGDRYHGKSIYEITKKMPEYPHLTKGLTFYLDNLHKDHFEVFTGNDFKFAINLDGSINEIKTRLGRGRRI